MDAYDGWPKVWAEMSDEELQDLLRHYLFLAVNSPLQHAKRIAQLVVEPRNVGAYIVDEGRELVRSHESTTRVVWNSFAPGPWTRVSKVENNRFTWR
jgi:hypothetical protein